MSDPYDKLRQPHPNSAADVGGDAMTGNKHTGRQVYMRKTHPLRLFWVNNPIAWRVMVVTLWCLITPIEATWNAAIAFVETWGDTARRNTATASRACRDMKAQRHAGKGRARQVNAPESQSIKEVTR